MSKISMICFQKPLASRIESTTTTYVFMVKSGQDFDLSQSALTVGLMLKWSDLFDGHFGSSISLVI